MARELGKTHKEIRPVANSISTAEHVTLRLDMPGVTKDHLDIRVDGNELTVVGRRNAEASKGVYLRRERPQGDFKAVYTLDDTIDASKINAKLDSGVLTLSLGFRDEVKPRKIEVKTS